MTRLQTIFSSELGNWLSMADLSHGDLAQAWLQFSSVGGGIHLAGELKQLVPLHTMTLHLNPGRGQGVIHA